MKHRNKFLMCLIGLSVSTLLASCNANSQNNESSHNSNDNITSNDSSTNKPSDKDTSSNKNEENETPLIPLVPAEPVTPEQKPDEEQKDEIDLSIDPFYPTGFSDTPYELNVPSLKDRLTLDKDKNLVTIFAPGVSKESGFYDVNKNFINDNHLCWAASNSNIIAWYLDRVSEMNINLEGYTRDVNSIFDKYRANWNYLEGFDPMQGFAWYFTGKTLTPNAPSELLNPNSGGYLSSLPYVGDQWSIIDPVNHYPIVGNYSEKYPFMDDNLRLDETHLDFSKNIVGQLHYGPSALMILKKGVSNAGSHAITLWGADYEATTGLVKAIYVTDSDDAAKYPGTYLNRVVIKENNDDYHGIRMVDYYLPNGEPAPFSYIGAGTNLFAPSVVKIK